MNSIDSVTRLVMLETCQSPNSTSTSDFGTTSHVEHKGIGLAYGSGRALGIRAGKTRGSRRGLIRSHRSSRKSLRPLSRYQDKVLLGLSLQAEEQSCVHGKVNPTRCLTKGGVGNVWFSEPHFLTGKGRPLSGPWRRPVPLANSRGCCWTK